MSSTREDIRSNSPFTNNVGECKSDIIRQIAEKHGLPVVEVNVTGVRTGEVWCALGAAYELGYRDCESSKLKEYNQTMETNKNLSSMDDAELITELVNRFRERNSFKNHIESLSDTTPNEWNSQLERACSDFETALEGVCQEYVENLFEGDFV